MSEPFSAGRRRALKIGAALIAGSALSAGGWTVWHRGRNLYQIRRERTLMQTSVSINVFSSDPTAARRAIQAAFERMATVVAILNRFDPHSAVARRKASPLDYAMLGELNTRPRTTYEALIRNRNPALGDAAEGEHA